jgi:hypothetical protein
LRRTRSAMSAEAFMVSLCPAILDRYIGAFDETGFA